jgi:hypothetical protein
MGESVVTLHSISGKCILRAGHCTQIPEFMPRLYSNPGQSGLVGIKDVALIAIWRNV